MADDATPRFRNVPLVPRHAALFLDIDGTLLPIARSPMLARTNPLQIRLLRDLQRALGGALALVSGRPIGEIDRLYQPLRLPVAGQHGAEVRSAAGEVTCLASPGAGLDSIRRRVMARYGDGNEILVEDKGLSLALHYRLAPERGGEVEAFLKSQLCFPEHRGWVLQAGKMVFEVRPEGVHKGGAIATLLATAPFTGRLPIFAGDDVTDEDGFQLVNGLGGETVKVGLGPTAAKHRLPGARAVQLWLQRSLQRLNDGGAQ